MVFPYGITLLEGGGVKVAPIARVNLRTQSGDWRPAFLIVDSGATISALPKTDAEILGIKLENGIPVSISSIGSEKIEGWKHVLSIKLGNSSLIKIPFVFLNNVLAPRVLGRDGIFDNFTIIFEEYKRRSSFLGSKTKESRIVSRVLDENEARRKKAMGL